MLGMGNVGISRFRVEGSGFRVGGALPPPCNSLNLGPYEGLYNYIVKFYPTVTEWGHKGLLTEGIVQGTHDLGFRV